MPCLAVVVLLALAGTALGQDEGITVRADPSGRISMLAGGRLIGIIELSLHTPGWTHVAQSRARAQSAVEQGEGGPVLVHKGTLPIPGGEAGLAFVQKTQGAENGFFVDYDITCEQDVTLNAIQVSLLMPEALYRGGQAEVTMPGDAVRQVPLAQEQAENFVLFQGKTNQVGIAPPDTPAIAIGAKEGSDTFIHDLRRWDQPYFEVRYTLVFNDEGQDIVADTNYQVPLAIGFDVPVTVEGLPAAAPAPEGAAAATGAEA